MPNLKTVRAAVAITTALLGFDMRVHHQLNMVVCVPGALGFIAHDVIIALAFVKCEHTVLFGLTDPEVVQRIHCLSTCIVIQIVSSLPLVDQIDQHVHAALQLHCHWSLQFAAE